MESLVRATNLRGFHQLVQELGGDPFEFLSRYHIPLDVLKDDKAFLPHRTLLLLIETTSRSLDCPDFGMRLSNWQGLDILGPIAVVARHENTVLNAFKAIAKYLYVHSPGLKLALVEGNEKGGYQFKFEIVDTNQVELRQPYELSLANGARIIRLLGGQGAHPLRVSFMHKQLAITQTYRDTFGCAVLFEQDWNGFKLSSALAHRKINTADSDTRLLVTDYLESQFAPGTTTLSVRVSELIRKLLPTGQCNANTIAEQLAMHPRTLQRRLADEDTRYDKLLDVERRKLAEHYLLQSGMQLSQISGVLGYSEQSAFNRSCKRWFSMTPRKFRLNNN